MNKNIPQTPREPSSVVPKPDSALDRFGKWLAGLKGEAPSPLQYFPLDKIILHVDHPADLDPEGLVKLIAPTVSNLRSQVKQPDPQTILKFPFQKNSLGQVFSLVPVEVTSANQDEFVKLLVDIYDQLKERPIIVPTSTALSTPVSIRAVSPNWFLGSTPHGPHPPSPGSWPVKAPLSRGAERNFRAIDQQGKLLSLANDEQGKEIHVAILDTAPSTLDLQEAYENWRGDPQSSIASLLTGKLHVHTGINTVIELAEYHPVGHRYVMQDHGLFVAGIINSLAPKAELHLIKVFTPYGSASTETIAQGLSLILQNLNSWRPLIVNCSFGLSIDRDKDTGKVKGEDFPDELNDPAKLDHMTISLREIFDQLTGQGDVVVVAAAGNDAKPGESRRPSSRYPAAFANVIGVGALPKGFPQKGGDYQPASYSNKADYMTFGGEPGDGEGVLGVYTSEFPVYAEGCLSFLWRKLTGTGLDGWKGPGYLPPIPPELTLDRFRYKLNETGLAWWAGTSFAAPAVTGFLAARWSGPTRKGKVALNFKNATDELNNYVQANPTLDGDKVFLVRQG